MCSFAWAKPSIEDVFVAASERRLLFLEAEREELDTMYTKLRNQQVRTQTNAPLPLLWEE